MLILSRHSDLTGERRWHYALNVTAGAIGLALAGAFARQPGAVDHLPVDRDARRGRLDAAVLADPSAFLTGTAAAAGIGIVNSIGNLGGYVGPNVAIWIKPISPTPPRRCMRLRYCF